ncbi:MAG: cyanophycinase [Saprospiraceae bacterium]|jgi:cyanophycinase|uniref:cyanophycinase n=1 Tax=Candidatus Brachybacter algidus TaxID=2982024 RepID=UPI001B690A9C|nr:cyanophycinase [Candidatus Brachybacter algidus]MBK7605553.1 cyanophycinase [Candidatus Brachybacter algidus]MBP7541444.1 cyanophycinase [Saprospiraceae bacterium]MBP8893868.1 cyanophycinase [Saprospiraceae bacterium]
MLKKNSFLFSIVLIILCIAFNTTVGQNKGKQGKLFIIGGGHKPASMINKMIDASGLHSGGYAVVLPMSSEEPWPSTIDIQEQFAEAGFKRIYGVMFKKSDLSDKTKLDSVANAKFIFISGGDQSRFMDLVAGSKLETAIHTAFENGTTIAGTSAGAAMMSEIMITGNQLKDTAYNATFKTIVPDNIETRKGLGLIKNAIIDQHFVIRSRHNRLLSAILQYPDMQGIGIDESTAILVDGGNVEVVGLSQVLVFSNPGNTQKVVNGKYGARGLTLDIYLPGEKFKLGK